MLPSAGFQLFTPALALAAKRSACASDDTAYGAESSELLVQLVSLCRALSRLSSLLVQPTSLASSAPIGLDLRPSPIPLRMSSSRSLASWRPKGLPASTVLRTLSFQS